MNGNSSGNETTWVLIFTFQEHVACFGRRTPICEMVEITTDYDPALKDTRPIPGTSGSGHEPLLIL